MQVAAARWVFHHKPSGATVEYPYDSKFHASSKDMLHTAARVQELSAVSCVNLPCVELNSYDL